MEIFSDKELTEQCGFVKQLNGGDVIMADKGFNVQDLLALKHVRLLAPPIMAKGKVSSKTTTITSRIATARAHVELIIRKSKCFELITGVIPLTLKLYPMQQYYSGFYLSCQLKPFHRK